MICAIHQCQTKQRLAL